jgi:hypothetical protein
MGSYSKDSSLHTLINKNLAQGRRIYKSRYSLHQGFDFHMNTYNLEMRQCPSPLYDQYLFDRSLICNNNKVKFCCIDVRIIHTCNRRSFGKVNYGNEGYKLEDKE